MVNIQTESHKGDILIVDDDLPSLSTLSNLLTAEGYEVRGAADGPMALTVVENQPPELILLDVKMPDMNGFEVCRQIQADETSSAIPILFLTAFDELEDKVKGFTVGAVDFISKPFQVDEVLARVDTHITLSRLRKNLERQVVERTAKIKRTKLKLEESEERFRAFMNNIPAAVYIKDDKDRHIYGNREAFESVGKKPEDFIGSTTRDFWPPQIADNLIKLDRKVMHENFPRISEEWSNSEKGDKRWRRDIKFPIKLESGKKLLGGIALDITDIKQNEQNLQAAYKEIEQLKEKLEQENVYLRQEIEVNYKHEEIVGKSAPVMEMLSRAEQVADTDATVLILGETGTGKELLARSIHKLSRRKDRQMIKVNCAAMPPTLIESELFGREKGAFTGAMTRQIGRFEIADKSTIFLDEIGELPLDVQAKLLRVLQEGQFERLGNPKTISVNVRIIASTNRDLTKAIVEGRFREDLYYRLNVFSVTAPPLRYRSEDIPLLVWAFVKELEKSMGRTIEKIPQKSIDALQQYSWPGNIRELRNVVENAMIISTGKILKLIPTVEPSLNVAKDLKLEVVERNHIIDVLKKTSWRVSGERGAAKLLGLKPTTLESRMKKLGIVRPR